MMFIILFIFALINSSLGQLPQGSNHTCYRACKDADRKVCEYEFHVEWFQTLTNACFRCPQNPQDCYRHDCVPGDGYERMVQVVNRRMPGPKIEVCEGDEIAVTVHNGMHEDSTTIHWHGQHQKGTQFMDGVPFVTQCPINPETIFKYRFRAMPGTHFWHSHTGVQRGNGVLGAIVVRRKIALERNLYDFDLSNHIIVIQDWTENPANEVFVKRYFDQIDDFPRSLLINGLGRYVNIDGGTRGVPAARFVVAQGSRYRFRIIQSVFMDVPVLFSIDGHRFSVIASDGADIQPITVDSLTLLAGERYDIVVTANQNAGLYWMRFQGQVMGEISQAHQAAVLQYSTASGTAYPAGVPTWSAAGRTGQQVNGLNMPPNNTPIDQLRAVTNVNVNIPAYQLYISYDLRDTFDPRFQLSQPSPSNDVLNMTELPRFNNIALKLFSFPLLSQKDQINENLYCNGDTVGAGCRNNFCTCPHILKLALGALVELVLIDEGVKFDVAHPIHLHGHYFQVIGSERLGNSTTEAQVWNLDQQGRLKRNFVNPPTKDTVQVPDGGYTIVRFYANNPGFWFLHCHVDFHLELGMGLIFQVGERSQMPSAPIGFPRCGDYTNPPAPPA